MLGSLYGMGADQVVALHVVTADGQFLTASASENSDLFWAIRGGGGSTFGVVTSMVVKVYPDVPTAVATFEWSIQDSGVSADVFWGGVASYLGHFESLTDQGLYAQINIFPKYSMQDQPGGKPRISVSPLVGIGQTVAQVKAATKPWLDEMAALGLAEGAGLKTTWEQFSSYYPAYYSQLAPSEHAIMPFNMAYGSRLLPRANFDRARKLNATAAAFRALVEDGHLINSFMLAPTVDKGRPVGGSNAVLPAWRDALSHTIVFVFWPADASPAEQMAIRRRFTAEDLGTLRDLTPGSGSYMSESDRLEPDWQTAFFGPNYPRLLELKTKYDPHDIFYAVQSVGSDRWTVRTVDGLPTENGPLCRVS